MNKIKLSGLILLALVIGLTSCSKQKQADTAVVIETPNVRLESTDEKQVEQSYELTATVQPDAKNSIAPSAPGLAGSNR